MARDLSLKVREAVVSRLRNDSAVVSLVPAGSIYGERQPSKVSWPFIRLGLPSVDSFDAQGFNGGLEDLTIHVFDAGPSTNGVSGIMSAIILSLHDAELVLNAGRVLDISYVQSQILPEGPDAFHGVVRFSVLAGVDA